MKTVDPALQRPAQARRPRELEWAFFAIIILSGVYAAYALLTEPRGGHPFGHWLGIVGTLLMVMTETLYSLRKRTRLLNWAGPVRRWLSFHIFTGLVGPFLVVMHTGLHFRGLAGFTMLLTLVVVLSGFIGRYLYSWLQRGLRGAAGEYEWLSLQIAESRLRLETWSDQRPQMAVALQRGLQRRRDGRPDWLARLARPAWRWLDHRALVAGLRQLAQEERGLERALARQLRRKQALEASIGRQEQAGRLFRIWHIIHIPLGLALFVSIAIHIVATIYFRAGLFR